MKWEKIGRIFNPEILKDMGLSAALMPIAEVLDEIEGVVRVYFSPRDQQNRSQVRYFDFNINNPEEVLYISDAPLFTHGKLGTFDDAGVTLSSIVKTSAKKFLFYTGWNLTVSVPFNNSIGIGEFSEDTIVRLGDGPIMTRTLHEPYSCASPFVMYEEGVFKMWYASMDKWDDHNDLRHFYNIKYAQSSDCINWDRGRHIAINYEAEDEYAFGRPFVLKEDGIYKMWYAFRGPFYKIGYAESIDGIRWERKDFDSGIEVSDSGWDSEMIEYPYVFYSLGEKYMLYNGNGYGKTGIGMARFSK